MAKDEPLQSLESSSTEIASPGHRIPAGFIPSKDLLRRELLPAEPGFKLGIPAKLFSPCPLNERTDLLAEIATVKIAIERGMIGRGELPPMLNG
jgi:hypothetical protein